MDKERHNSLIKQVCRLLFVSETGELPDEVLLERFVACRDQAAFELLAWRYGSMIFGVCRRLLRHEQDAEDALQATLLTLACKAASIGKSESLGSWLYKVAYRTSLRAKSVAAARSVREASSKRYQSVDPSEDAANRELLPILDAEINCLPDRYRIPFVLHCLEGKALHEVAGQLGRPLATVGTQVRRARERLSKRLGRRGVALTAGALAILNHRLAAAGASIPAATMSASFRSVAILLSGRSLSEHVPANVLALTNSAPQFVEIKQVFIALGLSVCIVGGSAAAFYTFASSRSSVEDHQWAREIALAPDPAPAHVVQARAVLDEALSVAPLIDNPTQQVWVLCAIARAQALAGQRGKGAATARQAVAVARGIDDESIRSHRLRDVAQCQAELGEVDGAVETASFIRQPDTHDNVLADIAAAEARAGRTAEAFRMAALIHGNEFRKGEALRQIAAAQAARRDVTAALETAAAITDGREKARCFAAVAAEQARAGDFGSAKFLFDQAWRAADGLPGGALDGSRDTILAIIAQAQAEAGLVNDARQTARSVVSTRYRSEAWKAVVVAEAKRGDPAAALESTDLISDDSARGEAVVAVVAALARGNDPAKARQVSETIRDELWRVYARVALAAADLSAGRREDAVKLLWEALQASGRLRDGLPVENAKPYALANVAGKLWAAGEEKAARTWLAGQPSPLVTALALTRVAEALAAPEASRPVRATAAGGRGADRRSGPQ